ncbi:hypothetical protein GCM10010166_42370 [Couchioplanes caeruleus subsp. azureus]|nr:hypothetical protein GCM10010166_42370 [Couchioplanes caeruleus subsp. azureus]
MVLLAATTGVLAPAPARAATVITPAAAEAAQTTLGVNVAPVRDYSTEWQFVDAFRSSRYWVSQEVGAAWAQGPALSVDAQGWVTRLEPGQFVDAPIFTEGPHAPGRYVVTWDGDGDVTIHGGGTITNRTRNRFEYEPGVGGRFLRITSTDPANYVRNIHVWMPGFEHTGAAQVFHPNYLERLRGMKTLRFMDWMQTNASRHRDWAGYPRPEWSTQTRSVAPELMIQLANRVGADPWVNIPHEATDEWVRAFAQTVRATMNPELKVYVEYSNELWNTAYAFRQTPWAQAAGRELGLADNDYQAGLRFTARRSVEIFRIWREVFGADADTRLVRVLGAQAGNIAVAENVASWQDAYREADALAIAPYFDCSAQWIAGDSRTFAPGHPTVAARVKAAGVTRLLDACQESIDVTVRSQIIRHKELADRYGLSLVAYEAGQHLSGVLGTENDSALMTLFHTANRHQRMRDLYARYLEQWRELGGGTIALFLSADRMDKWGAWGLREYQDQPLSAAPKARAADEFLQARGQLPLREAQPTVTNLSLRTGVVAGGAVLTLTGTNLASTSTVRFGGTNAPFRVVGPTQLAVTTPRSNESGVVDVTVTNPAGTSVPSLAAQFTYHPPPTVTGLSTPTALTIGGTLVTLTGTALTGATAVRLGTVYAQSLRVLSPTSLQFVAPARPTIGGVDVTVTTRYGTSTVVPAGRLSYVLPPRPVVSGLSADAGPSQVASTVLVNGSYLRGASQVTIGGQPARFTVLSDSQIRAVFPPQPGVWVNVHVTTPGGTSEAHSNTDFRYITVGAPSVTSLSVSRGPTYTATTVLINGSQLRWASRVTVGGRTVPFTQISETQLGATLPARAAGTVNIQVTTPGGVSAVGAGNAFTYVAPARPVVTELSVTRGLTTVRTSVVVTGTGFTAASRVTVGGSSVPFNLRSDTEIDLVLPTRSVGTANVQVTTPGGTSATGGASTFTWVAAL